MTTDNESRLQARTPKLDRVERSGWQRTDGDTTITCADGFTMSVIAGQYAYSEPREDHCGPYVEVEVGFPSERPEPWGPDDEEGDHRRDGETWGSYAETWGDPTGTVYGWVPVTMVRALVALHGGEVLDD